MENNNLGQVKISNEVIVTIAGLAALEVENVETITTITDKLLKNNGVKIQIDEEQIILDIYVNIEFGESIPDTAFKIQENVKNTVETMTGLEVSIVNVHVQGITFYKEKAEKEEAKAQKKEEAKLAKAAKKEEARLAKEAKKAAKAEENEENGTKAMHLVQANVNTIYIKDYLGHADISTTEVYARADNEAKRAALEKASLCLELPCASNWEQDADLIAWLSSLG